MKVLKLIQKMIFTGMMHKMVIADKNIDEREVNLLIDLYREAHIENNRILCVNTFENFFYTVF